MSMYLEMNVLENISKVFRCSHRTPQKEVCMLQYIISSLEIIKQMSSTLNSKARKRLTKQT